MADEKKFSAAAKNVILERSKAYANYYKAREALAQAHTKVVQIAVREGFIDSRIINVDYR